MSAASFSLTALVYNLRRALKHPWGRDNDGRGPGLKEARYRPGWTMQTTIAPSQPESCAESRENRQNKLRRGVTAQPEPFLHDLLTYECECAISFPNGRRR
jgi:hypothetical protein